MSCGSAVGFPSVINTWCHGQKDCCSYLNNDTESTARSKEPHTCALSTTGKQLLVHTCPWNWRTIHRHLGNGTYSLSELWLLERHLRLTFTWSVPVTLIIINRVIFKCWTGAHSTTWNIAQLGLDKWVLNVSHRSPRLLVCQGETAPAPVSSYFSSVYM